MALLDYLRRVGRRRKIPERETDIFPRLMQLGQFQNNRSKPAFKPTARNLRYFGRTPYARRAINAIKGPIASLEWEIVPMPGVPESRELERQAEIVAYCLHHPNEEDSFRSMTEAVIEDLMHGAGAIEQQIGSDLNRPLWLWPVDSLSIQIYANWSGKPDEVRYLQTIGYGSVGGGGMGNRLRDDELIYLKPNPTTAQPFGVGPLEIAFMSVSRQLAVADFAGKVSGNANPSAALFIGTDADQTRLDAIRAYWRNEVEGRGQMPIFGGTQPAAIRLHPDGDNALFLKYQELLIREIATAFDLSPQNLGVERDVNRNQGEVSEDRDWDHAIKPWANLYASALTRRAIHRRLGFHQLRFRFVGMDRKDERASAEIYQIDYRNNAVTPNERRAHLGLPPSEGPWGNLHFADMQIAVAAARGAKVIDDPALSDPDATPPPGPKT